VKTEQPALARPPGPKLRFVGGFRTFRHDALGFLLQTARTYGDVAWFRVGPFDIYLLSHPDHVRDVLVAGHHAVTKSRVLQEARRILGDGLLTSEGDTHKRNRRLLQPLFHHQRITGYSEVMTRYAARASERWRDGQELDLHEELMALTLAIVGKTLFGTDVDEAVAQRVAGSLRTMFDMYDRFFMPFAEYLERLPLPANRRFWQAKASLDEVIFGLIRDRRADGDRSDILSMLLAAGDGDGGHATPSGMSDRQIRDEATTIFLAGHETTSIALTWTFYLLSQSPEVEERLHRELDEVLGGRNPGPSDLLRLEFTRRVLSESLRLYPPAWTMGRSVVADLPLGGYVVPAGATVLLSQYVIHHDPRWYPDPWRFDPDRWEPAAVAARPKYSFFPFGAGPRMCIGEDFAWMEGMLVLATIAGRWRFRLVPGQRIALSPRITLRPKHGMRMKVERRLHP
jgi:cytochrome P450